MPTSVMKKVVQCLRGAMLRRNVADLTDGQLLGFYVEQRDETTFEALVQRHGPMVLGVCRRLLRNSQDAEDAFQATFLVLVRKADAIRPREMVGNWLYGVAYQTALKARAVAARRNARERQVSAMPEPVIPQQTPADWQPVLDRELNGLPEKYRVPIVLCDLEGKGHLEAARQLGWPQGTLSGRLSRGRVLLAKRLARRGVTLSAGSLATLISSEAGAHVPPTLMASTIQLASGAAFTVGGGRGRRDPGGAGSAGHDPAQAENRRGQLAGCRPCRIGHGRCFQSGRFRRFGANARGGHFGRPSCSTETRTWTRSERHTRENRHGINEA